LQLSDNQPDDIGDIV